MPPVDLHPEAEPHRWSGLEFELGADASRGPPALHVEYAFGRMFRVRHGARSCFLARLDARYAGLWWARPDESPGSLAVLPPIRAEQARAHAGDLRRWAWTFHDALSASPAVVLYPGTWRIEPPRGTEPSLGWYPVVRRLSECLSASSGYSKWSLNGSGDVFALRAPSPPDAARVNAWRKSAREGTLPPLLLFFVSGMDSWLLIDGHDRLQAALLEGVTPAVLLLSSVRTDRWTVDPEAIARVERGLAKQLEHPLTPAQIDGVNRRLIEIHREPSNTFPRTRAWAIPGGRETWLDEARALVAKGAPAELLASLDPRAPTRLP
ncbi:MAG: hypothetical protein WCJ30_14210 [Deltaproteobacteria bacterium]